MTNTAGIIPLSVPDVDSANWIYGRRTVRLGTRTLDVLHVASALVLSATKFTRFDRRRSRLAAIQRLQVIEFRRDRQCPFANQQMDPNDSGIVAIPPE